MRTPPTSAAFTALLPLLLLAGGSVGCHPDCRFAPGTPVADLPVDGVAPAGFLDCGPDEARTLSCCWKYRGNPDAGAGGECRHGSFDCTNVAPAEPLFVGEPYSGWECGQEAWHTTYFCGVWARDGGVVGSCGYCFPD